VKETVEREKPDVLVSHCFQTKRLLNMLLQFTASMWTPEQAKVFLSLIHNLLFPGAVDTAQEIVDIAKEIIPGLKTFSIPQGLQVKQVSTSRAMHCVQCDGGI
jgi:hypothetical protein